MQGGPQQSLGPTPFVSVTVVLVARGVVAAVVVEPVVVIVVITHRTSSFLSLIPVSAEEAPPATRATVPPHKPHVTDADRHRAAPDVDSYRVVPRTGEPESATLAACKGRIRVGTEMRSGR